MMVNASEACLFKLHPCNPSVYRHFERKVKGEGKNAIAFYKMYIKKKPCK